MQRNPYGSFAAQARELPYLVDTRVELDHWFAQDLKDWLHREGLSVRPGESHQELADAVWDAMQRPLPNPPPGWEKVLTEKGKRMADDVERLAGGYGEGSWTERPVDPGWPRTWVNDDASYVIEGRGGSYQLWDTAGMGMQHDYWLKKGEYGSLESAQRAALTVNPPPGWEKILTEKGKRMADDVEGIARREGRYRGREGEVAYRTVLARAKAGAKGLVHSGWAREHGYPKPRQNPEEPAYLKPLDYRWPERAGIQVLDTINDDREVQHVRFSEHTWQSFLDRYEYPRYIVQVLDYDGPDPDGSIVADNQGPNGAARYWSLKENPALAGRIEEELYVASLGLRGPTPLREVMRAPELAGMHYGRVESAAESLDRKGYLEFDGESVSPVSNPRDLDEHAVRELALYIENDADIYRQHTMPVFKNLSRKWRRGTFDASRAPKAFSYVVEAGAKKYVREFGGGTWHHVFPKPEREAVAQMMAAEFVQEAELGNLYED